MEQSTFSVIARMHSDFDQKFGIPRQSGLVEQLKARDGITEELKAQNQMEWVRQMNACKAQAEEIVKFELIYD